MTKVDYTCDQCLTTTTGYSLFGEVPYRPSGWIRVITDHGYKLVCSQGCHLGLAEKLAGRPGSIDTTLDELISRHVSLVTAEIEARGGTRQEIAARLGVGERTLYRFLAGGRALKCRHRDSSSGDGSVAEAASFNDGCSNCYYSFVIANLDKCGCGKTIPVDQLRTLRGQA